MELSDATKIAGNEWRVVKEWAMTNDYQDCEYYGTLSYPMKMLLEELRMAQKAQGDMAELLPQPMVHDMMDGNEQVWDDGDAGGPMTYDERVAAGLEMDEDE